MANNEEIKMSITEEDIKKLTFGQLIKTLSVGAWVWIIGLLCGIIASSFMLGYKLGVSQSSSSKQEMTLEQLDDNQISLVREIWKYQKSNKLNKVIISRDGFIFDGAEKKKTTINLADKVLGNRGDQFRFERLILSIPAYFLKQIPETRLDSPYVVTIPEEARKILDKNYSH